MTAVTEDMNYPEGCFEKLGDVPIVFGADGQYNLIKEYREVIAILLNDVS